MRCHWLHQLPTMVFSQFFNFVKVTLFFVEKNFLPRFISKKKFKIRIEKYPQKELFPSIGGGQYPNITIQ